MKRTEVVYDIDKLSLLENLPKELWLHIFSYLSTKELITIGLTDKGRNALRTSILLERFDKYAHRWLKYALENHLELNISPSFVDSLYKRGGKMRLHLIDYL